MAGDKNAEKQITVRCSEEFKQLLKLAAAAEDKNLSQYIRDTMRSTAMADLDPGEIEEAKRAAEKEASDHSPNEAQATN